MQENVYNLAVKTAEKIGCTSIIQREDVIANAVYVVALFGYNAAFDFTNRCVS